MKNLKRIACLVLALAVVCSLGLVAMAASEDPYTTATADKRGEFFPDVATANNEEAIYALVALGVFEGYPDGQFKPDRVIQRDEFAKIVFFFCGNDANDITYFASLKSQFKDVYEGNWAEGYINFCAISGYFKGYTDGTFKPDKDISMQEAATVLLRVLGYTDDLQGTWPNDYNRKAVDIGLTDYVDYVATNASTRDAIAQMAYNILDCYKVTYVGNTAANTGYLNGSAAAVLGTLYVEYNAIIEDLIGPYGDYIIGTILSYINMYTVDNEGYAYLYGRTNEGNLYYYDLMMAAFGAVKMDVLFADLDFYDIFGMDADQANDYLMKDLGTDMIESCGWHVANPGNGGLALDFYGMSTPITESHFSANLASLYYLVGGDLTDLGDTTGRVIVSGMNEAIFAATDGRDSWYANKAGGSVDVPNDYYDSYAEAGFGVFQSATADRHGYTTFSYVDSGSAAKESVVKLTSTNAPLYRFYNMTTGKFVEYTELVSGDLGYIAGTVGGATLILVYNASKGNLTEFTNNTNNGLVDAYAKIAGTKYTYKAAGTEQALFGFNGGWKHLEYSDVSNMPSLTTMEVTYAPAYRSTQLAYMAKDLRTPTNFVTGVVTGYTYGVGYRHLGDAYYLVRTYTGITIFTEAGETVTYDFSYPFDDDHFDHWNLGDLGDLITVQLTNDGKVVNPANDENDFVTDPYVYFFPTPWTSGSITPDAQTGRITIESSNAHYSDIYTLADDAVIFVLTTGATGAFAKVELMSTEDFLQTASYQTKQIAIYKDAGDNNTILGLYVVNCVATTQTLVGVAVGAGVMNGKYIVTMLDGTQFELRDANDQDLFNAMVPSFISFKVNYEGKMFDVERIIHQFGSTTMIDFMEFYDVYDGFNTYRIETGTFDNIYDHSVVTTDMGHWWSNSLTLFRNDDNIVYFNFTTGAATTMASIYSTAEANVNPNVSATNLAYVYDVATQELVYVFIISPPAP